MAQHRWYVTSPHKVGAFGNERPYGAWHARQPGRVVTECGERALGWPLFWELPFENQFDVCVKCAEIVMKPSRTLSVDASQVVAS